MGWLNKQVKRVEKKVSKVADDKLGTKTYGHKVGRGGQVRVVPAKPARKK